MEPTKREKLGFLAIFCSTVIILGMYIGYLLGVDYFLLSANPYSYWVEFTITVVMFLINIFFLFYSAIGGGIRYALLATMAYIPFYAFSFMFNESAAIGTTLLPLAIVVLVGLYHKDLKNVLVRTVLFSVLSTLYQWVMLQVKVGILSFTYVDLPAHMLALFSLDMFIFMGAISIVIGGVSYGTVRLALGQLVSSTFKNRSSESSPEDSEAVSRLEAYPFKTKVKLALVILLIQLCQLFVVLAISTLGNVLLEVVIILLSFWMSRWALQKCWHSDSVIKCTLISIILFYGGARFTLPASITVLLPACVGLAIAYGLYSLAVEKEKGVDKKNL